LRLSRSRQRERLALDNIFRRIEHRQKHHHFRFWRIIVGPRNVLGRIFLKNLSLKCWSRLARAVQHHRRHIFGLIFKAWKAHLRKKMALSFLVTHARRVLVTLLGRLIQSRGGEICNAFRIWKTM
jgi:hypothetical protein